MGIPVATVTSEGERLPQTAEVLSLRVHHELDRVPEATVTLLDGSVAQREFSLSNSAMFEPGRSVAIALRYEGGDSDETVFEGLVVRHAVETQAQGSVLRIELKDAAFKLTRRRKSAVHRDQSDEQAIRQLIEDAGLKAGELATTKPIHEELLQYYASDWDFIVSRADVQGLVVRVERGTVSLLPMVPAGEPKATYEYGMDDVIELELELDAGSQWAEVTGVAWDDGEHAATEPTPAGDPGVAVGNLDAAAIAGKLGGDGYVLQHGASLDPDEVQAWADARLARSRLALLRGRLVVDGRPDLLPGDLIELAGVGERFNGPALISAVQHRVDHDGWRTALHLGLDAQWFARQPDIARAPAAGLLPPATGLQLATVAPYEKDPKGEHRIKLELSALDAQQGVVWARFARPDAGKERGHVWWPEAGDEVVVGFVDDDPRKAVVLGSLYSKATSPPEHGGPPSKDNFQRAFVSRKGTRIVFDDENKAITISTPGDNTIAIDDGAKAITISDQHGNTVVMDDGGITISSAKDLTLSADGDVVISGSAVDIQ